MNGFTLPSPTCWVNSRAVRRTEKLRQIDALVFEQLHFHIRGLHYRCRYLFWRLGKSPSSQFSGSASATSTRYVPAAVSTVSSNRVAGLKVNSPLRQITSYDGNRAGASRAEVVFAVSVSRSRRSLPLASIVFLPVGFAAGKREEAYSHRADGCCCDDRQGPT